MNIKGKLIFLINIVIICSLLYLFFGVNFQNEKLFHYSMKIRNLKFIAMVITSFAIGGASIVFQSIINNTVVTPCLLGMNSLYMLIHTIVVFFFGSSSIIVINPNISFFIDMFFMGIIGTIVYSLIFEKMNYNILYIMLIGTVLSSFFLSIQKTLVRMMDPNEFDALLASLVPSFNNINTSIIFLSIVFLVFVIYFLRKELCMLDVLVLGKEQSINLGIDYDKCIKKLLLGVTLCIAIATAMVGPISFLGLIIANLSREYLKTYKHIYLILVSSLFGIIVLVGGQFIVERIYKYTIPINVFITIGGGIYFLYLLVRKK